MNYKVENIWDSFNGELYSYILSKVKDKDISKDILQVTFIKIQKNISSLRDERSLKYWIYKITYNSIMDHFRNANKKSEFNESYLSFTAGDTDADQKKRSVNDETAELAACIIPFMNKLPPIYKEALNLTEFHNYSQHELARQLGISYSGAKSRVQRAKVKLKELFEDCCNITYDKYGNIIEYHSRNGKKS